MLLTGRMYPDRIFTIKFLGKYSPLVQLSRNFNFDIFLDDFKEFFNLKFEFSYFFDKYFSIIFETPSKPFRYQGLDKLKSTFNNIKKVAVNCKMVSVSVPSLNQTIKSLNTINLRI